MTNEDFAELCKIYAPNFYKGCLTNEQFMNQPIEDEDE